MTSEARRDGDGASVPVAGPVGSASVDADGVTAAVVVDGACPVDGSHRPHAGCPGRTARQVMVEEWAEAERESAALGRALAAADPVVPLTRERAAELFDVPVSMVYGRHDPAAHADPVDPPVRERAGEQLVDLLGDPIAPATDPSTAAELAALAAAAEDGSPLAVEWGFCAPGGRPVPALEAHALDLARRLPGASVHCRVVGPWVRRG